MRSKCNFGGLWELPFAMAQVQVNSLRGELVNRRPILGAAVMEISRLGFGVRNGVVGFRQQQLPVLGLLILRRKARLKAAQ